VIGWGHLAAALQLGPGAGGFGRRGVVAENVLPPIER